MNQSVSLFSVRQKGLNIKYRPETYRIIPFFFNNDNKKILSIPESINSLLFLTLVRIVISIPRLFIEDYE